MTKIKIKFKKKIIKSLLIMIIGSTILYGLAILFAMSH